MWIAFDEEPEKVRRMAERRGIRGKVVCDGTGYRTELARLFKASYVRYKVLVGRDGIVRNVALKDEKLEPAILAALQLPAPPAQE